ncbi:hypothetical protein ACFL57_02165 [Candidatus Margulisiibacteriota bacterium]
MKNMFKAVFDKFDQYLTKKSEEKPCSCSTADKENDPCCDKENEPCCESDNKEGTCCS